MNGQMRSNSTKYTNNLVNTFCFFIRISYKNIQAESWQKIKIKTFQERYPDFYDECDQFRSRGYFDKHVFFL